MMLRSEDGAYTFTFLSSRLADGACGLRTTLIAMAAATAKATEVKKPKTFWTRTRLECILYSWVWQSGRQRGADYGIVCGRC